jgi:hypothetical protein
MFVVHRTSYANGYDKSSQHHLIPKPEHLCERCTLAVDYCRIAGIDRHEEAEPALRQRLVRYRAHA